MARPRNRVRRAIKLREAIYTISAACAGGDSPPTDAMALINDHRRAAISRSDIVFRRGRFERRWHVVPTGLDAIIWPIVESFTTLLGDEDRVRLLRECHGVDCGWLFLDSSRTKRRRWCRMGACGNRAKASRHYAKRR